MPKSSVSVAQNKSSAIDICTGADPYVFKSNDMWYMLVQENLTEEISLEKNLCDYTFRCAPTIEGLRYAIPFNIKVESEEDSCLKEIWAAEIHGNYLYVAASDGENKNHRMYVFQTNRNPEGPWRQVGKLKCPDCDDSWAIDLTLAKIKIDGIDKIYAVWSGWENENDDFPQNIYIAEIISPTEVGHRRLLATPIEEWCSSIKPILEGPQALMIDGKFRGILLTGNASWTEHYQTRMLKYDGGDPLQKSSWEMTTSPLFDESLGFGIGHGMIVQDLNEFYFVGHRKTTKEAGWKDRVVFYCHLDREFLESYLGDNIYNRLLIENSLNQNNIALASN